MDEALEVYRAGEILEGWEEVRVARSVEDLAGTFSLLFAEVHPDDPLARGLLRGEEIEIRVAGEVVQRGVIVRRVKAYDGSTNAVTVTGRDVLGDLVEASASHEPGEWNGARIATIARALLEPFPGLRFREDLSASNLGSVTKFALQTGETAFAALDRLARMRGLLLASDLAGGLIFTSPGGELAPVALERGVNVEAGSVEEDESGRFSRYIIHGAGPTPAYWDVGLGPGQSFRVEARDAGASRQRTLVIHAEDAAGEAELRTRVDFEASARAARALRVVYELPGWTLDGHLWQPGERVSVWDPILEIGGPNGTPVDLLVGSVDWSRSATGGSRTTLGLWRPGAFTPEPVKPPKGKKKASEAVELWLQ